MMAIKHGARERRDNRLGSYTECSRFTPIVASSDLNNTPSQSGTRIRPVKLPTCPSESVPDRVTKVSPPSTSRYLVPSGPRRTDIKVTGWGAEFRLITTNARDPDDSLRKARSLRE